MLDSETKRRIDSARDILVGKVPDPKSQVEQITIALIYKFMDDMDRQSVELGGKRSFFKGEFEKFSWKIRFGFKITCKFVSEATLQFPTFPCIFFGIRGKVLGGKGSC